ncbi:MAG: response regulator, partial [Oscillospiraceae bacterium]|nr:response regulator [Oscillospiraceae bacterium]
MANWIIVVDDDTSNLKMAGFILSKAQMRVTALQSGQALLDYIKKHEAPDLILLDILMPGMDGFETLRRLRQQEIETGREETPVVFLTADENTDTETHGFEVGVADYIRKPFNPEV